MVAGLSFRSLFLYLFFPCAILPCVHLSYAFLLSLTHFSSLWLFFSLSLSLFPSLSLSLSVFSGSLFSVSDSLFSVSLFLSFSLFILARSCRVCISLALSFSPSLSFFLFEALFLSLPLFHFPSFRLSFSLSLSVFSLFLCFFLSLFSSSLSFSLFLSVFQNCLSCSTTVLIRTLETRLFDEIFLAVCSPTPANSLFLFFLSPSPTLRCRRVLERRVGAGGAERHMAASGVGIASRARRHRLGQPGRCVGRFSGGVLLIPSTLYVTSVVVMRVHYHSSESQFRLYM